MESKTTGDGLLTLANSKDGDDLELCYAKSVIMLYPNYCEEAAIRDFSVISDFRRYIGAVRKAERECDSIVAKNTEIYRDCVAAKNTEECERLVAAIKGASKAHRDLVRGWGKSEIENELLMPRHGIEKIKAREITNLCEYYNIRPDNTSSLEEFSGIDRVDAFLKFSQSVKAQSHAEKAIAELQRDNESLNQGIK